MLFAFIEDISKRKDHTFAGWKRQKNTLLPLESIVSGKSVPSFPRCGRWCAGSVLAGRHPERWSDHKTGKGTDDSNRTLRQWQDCQVWQWPVRTRFVFCSQMGDRKMADSAAGREWPPKENVPGQNFRRPVLSVPGYAAVDEGKSGPDGWPNKKAPEKDFGLVWSFQRRICRRLRWPKGLGLSAVCESFAGW